MLPIVWAFNQLGWHAASQVLVLDRPDPALRPAAGAGPAVRARRPEPARRGDGAAGERQVLPLLHLHLHPVPVRQRDLRRVPVHRVGPELAGLRRRRWAGRPRSALALSVGVLGGDRHQHRARDGPQEGLAGALAVARSPWRRPATATSTSSTTAATTSASPRRRTRVGPLRRDVLGVPAAQRVGQPEVVVGAGGQAAAPGRQEPVALVQRRAQRVGDVGRALRRR